MQSAAKTVPAYIKESPIERQEALARLRAVCRAELKGFRESMAYGMPSYARNREVEVAFASQRNFVALYILRTDVMRSHRYLFNVPGVTLGKGCIRYSKPEKIDFAVVGKILRATQESTGPVC